MEVRGSSRKLVLSKGNCKWLEKVRVSNLVIVGSFIKVMVLKTGFTSKSFSNFYLISFIGHI